MRRHPLKGDRGFYAELTDFIVKADDHLAPWWVTLSRHNLEREAPDVSFGEMLDENLTREDLTALDFVTIDSASTQDMDDALFAEALDDGALRLTIAIADPTAYVPEGSQLDKLAAQRAFTNYLPGFNIPMLPRELSDDVCSLRPNVRRPALACRVTVAADGSLGDDVEFFAAWIESKAKLAYDDVSDWLENSGSWQPESEAIAEQIRLLHRLCLARSEWRQTHALVFKDRPDYRFLLGEKGEVLEIVAEPRRIANRIVEESMILANVCAAKVLRDRLGFGIYNVHAGFDATNAEQAAACWPTMVLPWMRRRSPRWKVSASCVVSLMPSRPSSSTAGSVASRPSLRSAPSLARTLAWDLRLTPHGPHRFVSSATWSTIVC